MKSPYKKVVIFGLTVTVIVMVISALLGYFNVDFEEASTRFLSLLILVTGLSGLVGIIIFDDKI